VDILGQPPPQGLDEPFMVRHFQPEFNDQAIDWVDANEPPQPVRLQDVYDEVVGVDAMNGNNLTLEGFDILSGRVPDDERDFWIRAWTEERPIPNKYLRMRNMVDSTVVGEKVDLLADDLMGRLGRDWDAFADVEASGCHLFVGPNGLVSLHLHKDDQFGGELDESECMLIFTFGAETNMRFHQGLNWRMVFARQFLSMTLMNRGARVTRHGVTLDDENANGATSMCVKFRIRPEFDTPENRIFFSKVMHLFFLSGLLRTGEFTVDAGDDNFPDPPDIPIDEDDLALLRVALNRKYKCGVCGQTRASPSELAIHMRVHTGERQHKGLSWTGDLQQRFLAVLEQFASANETFTTRQFVDEMEKNLEGSSFNVTRKQIENHLDVYAKSKDGESSEGVSLWEKSAQLGTPASLWTGDLQQRFLAVLEQFASANETFTTRQFVDEMEKNLEGSSFNVTRKQIENHLHLHVYAKSEDGESNEGVSLWEKSAQQLGTVMLWTRELQQRFLAVLEQFASANETFTASQFSEAFANNITALNLNLTRRQIEDHLRKYAKTKAGKVNEKLQKLFTNRKWRKRKRED
jgi:uncharacterized protein YukE